MKFQHSNFLRLHPQCLYTFTYWYLEKDTTARKNPGIQVSWFFHHRFSWSWRSARLCDERNLRYVLCCIGEKYGYSLASSINFTRCLIWCSNSTTTKQQSAISIYNAFRYIFRGGVKFPKFFLSWLCLGLKPLQSYANQNQEHFFIESITNINLSWTSARVAWGITHLAPL